MPRSETPFRALLAGTALAVAAVVAYRAWNAEAPPVLVAVLAPAGRDDIVAAARLAARELAGAGGPRGRAIAVVPLVHDGSAPGAVAAVERCLLEGDAVAVVAACSSEVRDAFGATVARTGVPILCVDPTVAMGESQRVFDLAGTPSQRVAPAVGWAISTFGPRVAILGSAGPLERVAATLAADQAAARGATPIDLGELPGGASEETFGILAETIAERRPDALLLALDGPESQSLAEALRRRGIDGAAVPTLHLTLTLDELRSLDARALVGDYMMSPVLSTAAAAGRADFARRLRATGETAQPGEAAELAHAAVRLAALAARRADPGDRPAMASALAGASVHGATGPVIIDPVTSTAWVRGVVARIEERGGLREVWADERATRPLRWPIWRTREEWVAIARGDLSARTADAAGVEDRSP